VKTARDVAFLGAEPKRANEIAFTAAYPRVSRATYLVQAGSPIRNSSRTWTKTGSFRIAVSEQERVRAWSEPNIKHVHAHADAGHRCLL
jgi:hypothetical protein